MFRRIYPLLSRGHMKWTQTASKMNQLNTEISDTELKLVAFEEKAKNLVQSDNVVDVVSLAKNHGIRVSDSLSSEEAWGLVIRLAKSWGGTIKTLKKKVVSLKTKRKEVSLQLQLYAEKDAATAFRKRTRSGYAFLYDIEKMNLMNEPSSSIRNDVFFIRSQQNAASLRQAKALSESALSRRFLKWKEISSKVNTAHKGISDVTERGIVDYLARNGFLPSTTTASDRYDHM